ncbi:MAG TPA: 2OG-Fe(II) oxygenase [Pseudomonas sabulinigri]|uniref:Prolyl 4-hydroxylase alpha subunit Fe(2+) 2OG dioxygenase domain-containing protein n=1 Tax=marine sediment metagenome TaxID=412755 RepID=A0A0F9T851_9ZZZZ|nr:2OG-Fe(II) oxygenase [Halopseudomonas sabulinigri]HEC50575.1 2OG-Fe(II) oxygenase [Halopseudomonas sabulinigri]
MGAVINRSLLATRRLSVNLVTYPEGHRVPRHNDPMGGGSYYKLNLVLKKPLEGGIFQVERTIFSFFNRVILFRPDLYDHHVSTIARGKRVLLSFAFLAPWGATEQGF